MTYFTILKTQAGSSCNVHDLFLNSFIMGIAFTKLQLSIKHADPTAEFMLALHLRMWCRALGCKLVLYRMCSASRHMTHELYIMYRRRRAMWMQLQTHT